MTTSQLIQARIDKGNAIAARQLGIPYSQYRPSGPSNPIAPANLVRTTPALFSQEPTFTRLPKTKSDEFYGYFDGSLTQPGDYLVAGTRTFFVAAQQPLLPYLCIATSRVITLLRAASSTSAGRNGYGGSTSANQTAYLTAWPASCMAGTKGETGDIKLPDDVRAPWWSLRLPALSGVLIRANDIITDDIGRRYTVSSAELSDYGWRLTARQDVS